MQVGGLSEKNKPKEPKAKDEVAVRLPAKEEEYISTCYLKQHSPLEKGLRTLADHQTLPLTHA